MVGIAVVAATFLHCVVSIAYHFGPININILYQVVVTRENPAVDKIVSLSTIEPRMTGIQNQQVGLKTGSDLAT